MDFSVSHMSHVTHISAEMCDVYEMCVCVRHIRCAMCMRCVCYEMCVCVTTCCLLLQRLMRQAHEISDDSSDVSHQVM